MRILRFSRPGHKKFALASDPAVTEVPSTYNDRILTGVGLSSHSAGSLQLSWKGAYATLEQTLIIRRF